MMLERINRFKNREIKARDLFEIKEVSKKDAREIVKRFHYLGEKDFMFNISYGIFIKGEDEILGCAIFGMVGGNVALKGWFGVDNTHSNEYLELTRLVMNPILNGCNATSYLLGNAIKQIKKDYPQVKAIVSLADNGLHNGAIYQACNFKYYGLTDKKTDFYVVGCEGKVKRCGTTKDKQGVWLPRSQKHRYLYIIDKNVKVNYKEEKYPKGNSMNIKPTCCNGTHVVYDKRFDKYYTCPKCCVEFRELTEEEVKVMNEKIIIK